MLTTFLILLPVFALILAGYLCRRRGLLGPAAASEINRFVVWLALPALLFDIMAHTAWHAIWQPGFFWSFVGANAVVFGGVLAWQRWRGKPLADASLDAVAASYPNTGYVGFPLLLLVFGDASRMPTTMATIIVACVFFAFAIALMEAGLQTERNPRRMAARIAGAVLKNPLVVAPILGSVCMAAAVPVPAGVETFLKLLGGAASPCALVGLGVFLADRATRTSDAPAAGGASQRGTAAALVAAKLALQPVLVWLLATRVFALPPDLSHMAVLLGALPTGTGPFMLAEYYRRDGALVSSVILVSTVVSIPTLVAAMALMGVTPG
jgi:malonate transporter and related proteins